MSGTLKKLYFVCQCQRTYDIGKGHSRTKDYEWIKLVSTKVLKGSLTLHDLRISYLIPYRFITGIQEFISHMNNNALITMI